MCDDCTFYDGNIFVGCPQIPNDVTGTCTKECTNDINCFSGQKCCFNGCGRTCMDVGTGKYNVAFNLF